MKKQNIVFDTCILIYTAKKHIKCQLISYIDELQKRGFQPSISEISICELLIGADSSQEKKQIEILKSFERFPVEIRVLRIAAILASFYKEEKNQFQEQLIPDASISLADTIIAATSIINKSLIFTADVNDFPRPFFKEFEENLIHFKSGNKTRTVCFQLLEPNYEIIKQRLDSR